MSPLHTLPCWLLRMSPSDARRSELPLFTSRSELPVVPVPRLQDQEVSLLSEPWPELVCELDELRTLPQCQPTLPEERVVDVVDDCRKSWSALFGRGVHSFLCYKDSSQITLVLYKYLAYEQLRNTKDFELSRRVLAFCLLFDLPCDVLLCSIQFICSQRRRQASDVVTS